MKLWRTVAVIAAALASSLAVALSIRPPDPIPLRFEARSERLTRSGLVAVDKLAVLAAQCLPEELAVHIEPAAAAQVALTKRRVAVVKQSLDRLGLKLTVELKPLRQETDVRPAHRDVLLSDVGAADDVWCNLRERSQLFRWAQELGRYVEGLTPTVPAFWRRMSAQVKLRDLALPLARAAYCLNGEDCEKHPEVFQWLAGEALQSASTAERRRWLLQLWVLAEDQHVERLRKRWSLEPLTVSERAGAASQMVDSDLPWPVIEGRVRESGVLESFEPSWPIMGGREPDWLLEIALEQGQLEAFGRLIGIAGAAKSCHVEAAVRVAADSQDGFELISPHLASWMKGSGGVPHKRSYWPDEPCDPAALLMQSAFCPHESYADEFAARSLLMWRGLIASGFTPDPQTVQRLTSPPDAQELRTCTLEPVPGSDMTFRPRKTSDGRRVAP